MRVTLEMNGAPTPAGPLQLRLDDLVEATIEGAGGRVERAQVATVTARLGDEAETVELGAPAEVFGYTLKLHRAADTQAILDVSGPR